MSRIRKTIFLCLTVFYACSANAAYRDDIRYTELETELHLRGASIPDGSGVSITQVEVPEATNEFMPDTSNSDFDSKTITDQTGGGLASDHATRVGRKLYGNQYSIAPGITDVDVYDANDWISSGWYSGSPPTENNPLQNHSWVNWFENSNAPIRMDYAASRDGFLPIAGLYNSDFGAQTTPSDIPDTYGSIYNGITVGVSDGTHRYGTTSYDGNGRVKPEIVAPGSTAGASASADQFTSFATPVVTAAAAMLIESAGSDTLAKDQLTLKAILLAGADKSISANWDQTPTRPIDEQYGAGELDIYESFFIQTAGQQIAGSTINTRGWNLETLGTDGTHSYTVTVPEGFELRDLSVLVTWNRTVEYSSRRGGSYSASLSNLALELTNIADSPTIQSSDSSVDNIEHIWRNSNNALSSGDYTIAVSVDGAGAEYAIAWRSELHQDYTLWSSTEFSESTPIDQRDADDDPDQDGIKNLLEQAFGGDPETHDLGILPISTTVEEDGQSYLEISFHRPTFDNRLTYKVETVTDLNGTWSSSAAEVELISISEETSGFDRYTYRRIEPVADQEKAFLRVEISNLQ